MSAVVGERDTLIMNTLPRHAAAIDRALLLTPSATLFEVSVAGVPTPESITFSALMLGAVGDITFSSEPPVPLAVANGDAVLAYADMTASVVTVTATTVIDGLTYVARQTVAKQQALDLTPPPAPSGLATTGTPATIVLRWAAPPANYNNLSHTEVWRAQVNNFAQAALVGRADGREYTDPVGPGAFRYYWIRYVSRAAIPGPYNAGSGTVGASDVEVEHLLGVLTGEITASQLNADLGAKIDLIDELDAAYGDTAGAAASAAAATSAAAAALLAKQQADSAAGLGGEYAAQSLHSATTANTAASKANTYRDESAQAASSATGSAAAAQSSAGIAADSAFGAGNSARAAAGSSFDAASHANGAETAAASSMASKISAEAARDGAAGSAQASSGDAATAAAKAHAAGESAVAAHESATEAKTKAAAAGVYAGQAAESETRADGSARAAADFFQQAQATLKDPVTGLVTGVAAVKAAGEATADSVAGLKAKYAIKLDVGDVVGGLELLGGGGVIDFAVRASTFSIASPAGSGIPTAMPFIVRTTETVIDGVTIPIGMYVADAFIQNASITNAKIGGDIWSSNYAWETSGWYLERTGNFYANNVRLRGSVAGGAFTSFAWPSSGGGYYLGPEGLLLGNYNTGRYVEMHADGTFKTPGLLVANGKATFTGNVVSGSGTGFRVEMGPDDPTYVMWAGTGVKNDINAIFYIKRDGSAYFGGSLSAGVLKTAVSNPAFDLNAQVVDGPFGSNGGTINVVCSLDWGYYQSSRGHDYSPGSGSVGASLYLYRKIGAGAEELVQSLSISGSVDIENYSDPDQQSTCSQKINGAFTYTDMAATTQNRTYRAVVAIVQQSITMTPRRGSDGGGAFPDSFGQRLTLITTE